MSPRKDILSFNDSTYVTDYDTFRNLSEKTIEEWITNIQNALPNKNKINFIDLGAGTGRFILPFAKHFKEIEFYALDNSNLMSKELHDRILQNSLHNIRQLFFDFNNDQFSLNYDAIFISDAFHLAEDKKRLLKNIFETINENGVLIIRTAPHHGLDKIEWLSHFPVALAIDKVRTLDAPNIAQILKEQGFSNIRILDIDESKLINNNSYIKMIENKLFSILREISGSDFSIGLENLKKSISDKTTLKHTQIMSCIIALKTKT